MRRTSLLTAVLICAVLVPAAAPAGGATGTAGGQVKVAAAGGDRAQASSPQLSLAYTGYKVENRVTIELTSNGQMFVITDVVPIAPPDPPCVSDGPNRIRCPAAGVERVVLILNGGDDSGAISPVITLPTLLDGGNGEDLFLGGSGEDEIVGGKGNDRLAGRRGRDFLRGNAGRDVLRGGLANDRLLGGVGTDRLFGGRGLDVVRGGPGRDLERQ